MYRIVSDDEVTEQVTALPVELLLEYAEVLDLLERAPWSGEPYHSGKPGGAMRRVLFGTAGRGVVIYLIFEDQQRVDLLRVHWL